ncbi:MAG: intradiol ring-cleavage dioxygenase [Sphingobium sp.]
MEAPIPAETTGESRRTLLKALIAAPVAMPVLAGSARAAEPALKDAGASPLAFAAATMGLISSNVCAVTPATTEGPYYTDPKLVRRDITEGRPGIALRMQLQVVTADCRPLAGARVDIWQCDAQGDYSGYANMGSNRAGDTSGQTFLRGTQMTDGNGIVTFDTVYPGWYRGRTTHIHYKVFLDEKTVLTSQIFFPDALSEYIYLKNAAYARGETRDTVNALDGIAEQAGQGACCTIREQKDRYVAALVVSVDPSAEWRESGPGMGGFPPPGAPPPRGLPPDNRPSAGPDRGPGAEGGRPPGPPPGGSGGPIGQRGETTPLFPGTTG